MKQIKQMQLDPNGFCNAKCWFCPVAYHGNPEIGKDTMPVELMEKIFQNIVSEREKENGLVHKSFNGFYPSHYNEVLLYHHFEEMLELCDKYGFYIMVLSNGLPLKRQKTDLLKKYRHILSGICLNVPAFDKETWSKRSGMKEKNHDRLMDNIKYAIEQLPEMVANGSLSIQVNGVHRSSFDYAGGWMTKGPDYPKDMDEDETYGELAQQVQIAKETFPGLNIFGSPYLVDRAGLLNNVMSNKPSIVKLDMKDDSTKKVIGCKNGNRPDDWLHINAKGKVFLCCNDYYMEHQYGDFSTQEISDFWQSEKHIEVVEEAYGSICRDCAAAVYET